MSASDTICAIATAPGDGAIGILRLSGPMAIELLCGVTAIRAAAPRKLLLTSITDPATGLQLDQVMVCVMPGPRSYSGEDVVEVYAHGGQFNMQALLALFVDRGARQADPGEFTRRAFVNGRMDLTQAEAVAEVISARSRQALRNAQALLGGELGRRVKALRRQALDLGADLEACLDFAEDVQQPVSGERLREQHRLLIAALEQLVATYARGRRLNGLSVALVGQVNAGKSSLLNALHGSQRALVSQQEGTTRDYLEVELAWEGQAVTLVDTAGARHSDQMSPLERAGHALGSERVATCDARILVVDVAHAEQQQPQLETEPLTLVAAHKADLLGASELAARCQQLARQFERPVVATSAISGVGLDQLRREVLRHVAPVGGTAEQGETVVLTQARQHDALCRALRALRTGAVALDDALPPELVVEHTREALTALGEVTGESYGEELLDSVFARFCIGK